MSSSGESTEVLEERIARLDAQLQSAHTRRGLLPELAALDDGREPRRALKRFLRGDALYYLDRDDEALEKFRDALDLARAEQDVHTLCRALYRIVEWHRYMRRGVRLVELVEAESLAERLDDSYLRARGQLVRARLAVDAGERLEGIARFEQALTGYLASGRDDLAAMVAVELCRTRSDEGLTVDPALFAIIVDLERRCELALEVGGTLVGALRAREAEPILQVVLRCAPPDSSDWRRARALEIACRQISVTVRDDDVAWLFDERNLEHFPDPGLIRLLRSIHWMRVGAFESLRDEAEQGLKELSEVDEPLALVRRGLFLARRGHAACRLGDGASARSALDEAQELMRDLEPLERVGVLEDLLQIRYLLDGPAAAASVAAELTAAAREAGCPRELVGVYEAQHAQCLADIGHDLEARQVLRGLEAEKDWHPFVAGIAAHVAGRLDGSPASLERAATHFARVGLTTDEIRSLDDAASLYLERDDRDGAFSALAKAVRAALLGIDAASLEEDRLMLQSRALDYASRAASIGVSTNPRRAFGLALEAKGAALRCLRAHRAERMRVEPVRLSPQFAPSFTTPMAAREFVQWRDALSLPSDALDDVRTRYRELARTDPAVRRIHAALEVSVDEVIGSVPADVAAIEFLTGDAEVHAFVIVDGDLHARTLNWTDEVVDALVCAYEILHRRSSLPGATQPDVLTESLAVLHDFLIQPLLPLLRSKRTWLVSPGARLAHVPLAALFDGQRHLIEDHDLVFTTSLARLPEVIWTLGLPTSATVVRGVDAPGAGRLRHADREAVRIGEIAGERGVRLLHGNDPFAGELVHYVGHAIQQSEHWMAAAIFPSGGPLTAPDVLERDLRHVRLCTLSACETGKPHWDSSDEYGGFLRACFAAGVRQALMTQWVADDEGTTALMEAFYERWLAGMPLARALGEAMRALLAKSLTSTPSRDVPTSVWANAVCYV